MGAIAESKADIVILTSDNPRTEDPELILDDIEAGMRGRNHERIEDRRAAIARAMAIARPGDLVLLAGKGHETYQIRGTESFPFDEREIVKRNCSREGVTLAMMTWTLDRLAHALRAHLQPAMKLSGTAPLGGISTDTRSLAKGDVFVALRGERFDGHDFLAQAAQSGAAAFVVDDPARATGLGVPVFAVRDTTRALGALGTWWRTTWGGTVVAVAGSNGKTTTKELIRSALAGGLDVHATTGNLNNQVGVPLTLLRIPSSAMVAVVEVGTSIPGEIALLRDVVAPDVSVVTSIGEEHLEGLGSLEGVLAEEAAIYQGVPIGVAPIAQPEVGQAARSRAVRVVEAGLDWRRRAADRLGHERGRTRLGDVR